MKQPDIPYTDLIKLDVKIRVNWNKTYNEVIKMLTSKFPQYSNNEDAIKRVADTIMLDLVKAMTDGDNIVGKRNGGAEAMYMAQLMTQWEKDGVAKFKEIV